MDWTKSKTILIVALVITNIFLLINYISKNDEMTNSADLEDEKLTKILEDNNILLHAAIPKEEYSLPVIEVEIITLSEDEAKTIVDNYEKKLPVGINSEGVVAFVETFLKDNKLEEDNLEMVFSLIPKGYIVSYKNLDPETNKFIEESNITCQIKDGKIIKLEKNWIKVKEYGKTAKDTISAKTALLKFHSENEIEGTISINKIEMVYWVNSIFETTTFDTAFPAWKITYGNKEPKYIPAYK